jgi:cytochrome b561
MEIGLWLNLGSSVCVALLIIVFLILIQNRNFWVHWVTKTGFVLWCVQWAAYLISYFIFVRTEHISLTIPILDAASLCTFLFALVFLSGDDAQANFWKSNLKWIGIVVFVLIVCTMLYALRHQVSNKYKLLYTLASIAPSELLANLGTLAMGWAFVVRYRSLTSYILLSLCVLYAVAQLPGYTHIFIFRPESLSPVEDNVKVFLSSAEWVFPFFLAPMKIIIAILCLCLFYTPFFDNLSSHSNQSNETAIWPTDPILESSKLPEGNAIPLPKQVQRVLQISLSVFWAIVGFISGLLSGGILTKISDFFNSK